jgi:hypothetical protein
MQASYSTRSNGCLRCGAGSAHHLDDGYTESSVWVSTTLCSRSWATSKAAHTTTKALFSHQSQNRMIASND